MRGEELPDKQGVTRGAVSTVEQVEAPRLPSALSRSQETLSWQTVRPWTEIGDDYSPGSGGPRRQDARDSCLQDLYQIFRNEGDKKIHPAS